MCQYLAVECAHPSSPAFEDGSSSEASTPVPAPHLRPVRARRRRQSPVPALPIVVQLMEMGFPRRNIELALKALAGAAGNAAGLPGVCAALRHLGAAERAPRSRGVLAGVEALVGWLLDHADVPGTDLSDPDTGSEDGSEEELLEDLDDTACALVSAPSPVPACASPRLCRAPRTPGRQDLLRLSEQTLPHTWGAGHSGWRSEGPVCLSPDLCPEPMVPWGWGGICAPAPTGPARSGCWSLGRGSGSRGSGVPRLSERGLLRPQMCCCGEPVAVPTGSS